MEYISFQYPKASWEKLQAKFSEHGRDWKGPLIEELIKMHPPRPRWNFVDEEVGTFQLPKDPRFVAFLDFCVACAKKDRAPYQRKVTRSSIVRSLLNQYQGLGGELCVVGFDVVAK